MAVRMMIGKRHGPDNLVSGLGEHAEKLRRLRDAGDRDDGCIQGMRRLQHAPRSGEAADAERPCLGFRAGDIRVEDNDEMRACGCVRRLSQARLAAPERRTS